MIRRRSPNIVAILGVLALIAMLLHISPVARAEPAEGQIDTYAGGEGPRSEPLPAATEVGQVPENIAVKSTPAGDYIYISDTVHNVVRVRHPDGKEKLVAGIGVRGTDKTSENTPAKLAKLNKPGPLALTATGDLLIVEASLLRKVASGPDGLVDGGPDEAISTVAGGGTRTHIDTSTSIPATELELDSKAIAVDSDGSIVLGDTKSGLIRITGNQTKRVAGIGSITGITIDQQRNIFVANSYPQIQRVSVDTNPATVTRVGGGFANSCTSRAGVSASVGSGPATLTDLCSPKGIAVAGNGDLVFVDANSVRKIGAGLDGTVKGDADETISTIAGGPAPCPDPATSCGDGGPAQAAQLNNPVGLALAQGAGPLSLPLYIADTGNNRVRKIDGDGMIGTLAGNGRCCLAIDGMVATESGLSPPSGVASDNAGTLFVAEPATNMVRKISTSGDITRVAGNWTADFGGDGGQATQAELNSPTAVATDATGNLYIADSLNNRIRKVSANDHIITTIAGSGIPARKLAGPISTGCSTCGLAQEIPVTTARVASDLNRPAGVAVDASGGVFVADTDNNRVVKVGAADSTGKAALELIAGTGATGSAGDGGDATLAELKSPQSLAVDTNGDLYIADTENKRVRKVAGVADADRTHHISTVGGELGAAPTGLALNRDQGQLAIYVSTAVTHKVVELSEAGVRNVVAGTGAAGFSGDQMPAPQALLNGPSSLAAKGNTLFISDTANSRIRRVRLLSPRPQPALSVADATFPAGPTVTTGGIKVTLAGEATGPVSVKYATRDGTATTRDYAAASGTLVFSPQGQGAVQTRTIQVQIKARTQKSPPAKFYVDLSSAAGALLSRATGAVTINDALAFGKSGAWLQTAYMREGRQGFSATVLDGPACQKAPIPSYCGRVLVAGGTDTKLDPLNSDPDTVPVPKATTELFDPDTQSWEQGPSMNVARYNHTATALKDGRVLIVGPGKTAEIYDPAAGPRGSWTKLPEMTLERNGPTATPLPDGRVLVAGGTNLFLANPTYKVVGFFEHGNQLSAGAVPISEIFDPVANAGRGAWSPTKPMAVPRSYHTATLVWASGCVPALSEDCERVLVAGGSVGEGEDLTAGKSAELYNPSNDSWSPTGSLTEGRLGHQAVALPDGKVLVLGGCFATPGDHPCVEPTSIPGGNSDPHADAELYDPATGLWSPSGTMNAQRGGPTGAFTALLLRNGKVLAAGGAVHRPHDFGTGYLTCVNDPSPVVCRPVFGADSSADLFDASSSTPFQRTDAMNFARVAHASVLLKDGRVLVAGGVGTGDDSPAQRSAEIYDLSSATPADLSVSLTARPDPASTKNPLTYTIEVANHGPSNADQVVVTDTLLPGASFESAGSGCLYGASSRSVTCTVGSLQKGQSTTRQITVRPTNSGKLNNSAVVAAFNKDPDLSNNQASVQTMVVGAGPDCTANDCADLSITKSASTTSAAVGDDLTYTLAIKNNGPKTAPAVSVFDQLPPQVSYRSASPGCTPDTGNSVVHCSIGRLDPGEARSVKISVSPKQSGTIKNVGSVSDDNVADPDLANNSSTASTEIRSAVSISDAVVDEGDSGATKMEFTVLLSGGNQQPVSVDFETVDATALEGEDYHSSRGTLTFPAGQDQAKITVPVVGDQRAEPYDEEFVLRLFNPKNTALVRTQARGIIHDDDGGFTVSDTSVDEGPQGRQTEARFTISRAADFEAQDLHYQTRTGTAGPADFKSAEGNVTFAKGETEKTVSVEVNGDDLPEGNEDFFLDIVEGTGRKSIKRTGKATIIDDDKMVPSDCGPNPKPSCVRGWHPGDVFVAAPRNRVFWFDSLGLLVDTLGPPKSFQGTYTTGMNFNRHSDLVVTTMGDLLLDRYNPRGQLTKRMAAGINFGSSVESVIFDKQDNMYVGTADSNPKGTLLKFDPAGNLIRSYTLPVEKRGVDWIDLAGDQCTLFYTSEGSRILRYDLCRDAPLPDFGSETASIPGVVGTRTVLDLAAAAFALRILPDGGVLVADANKVVRLDSMGRATQFYTVAGAQVLFALNLDPDKRSFWTADTKAGLVYKFDILSGALLNVIRPPESEELTTGGLAVYGECTDGAGCPLPLLSDQQQSPVDPPVAGPGPNQGTPKGGVLRDDLVTGSPLQPPAAASSGNPPAPSSPRGDALSEAPPAAPLTQQQAQQSGQQHLQQLFQQTQGAHSAQVQVQTQTQAQAHVQAQVAAVPIVEKSLERDVQVEHVRDSKNKPQTPLYHKGHGHLASALSGTGIGGTLTLEAVMALMGLAVAVARPRRKGVPAKQVVAQRASTTRYSSSRHRGRRRR